jgi:hypothetical protein
VKYTAFLYPRKGPGGGGGGGRPPILVGVGSPVLVETGLLVVMLLLPRLVGVTLILLRLVDDTAVLRLKLLVGDSGVLVGVLTTSVVSLLELVVVPIVTDEDSEIQESPPLPFVTLGAKAYIVVGRYTVVVTRAHSAELSIAETIPISKLWARAQEIPLPILTCGSSQMSFEVLNCNDSLDR